MAALYTISLVIAIIFYILGVCFKLLGGIEVFGIPPGAWIDKGANTFLLFAIVFILLRYLPKKE